MSVQKKADAFLSSLAGAEVRKSLVAMSESATYNTQATYSTDSTLYPDNLIPFVDKHMNYLSKHPATDPVQYLANLRLMTKVR